MELALSEYLGENDVVTSLSDDENQFRISKGFASHQNYFVPLKYYEWQDWRRYILHGGLRLMFRSHSSAQFIRTHVDKRIWNSYYKFCFERNPYDKAVSQFYYTTLNENLDCSINELLKSIQPHRLSNWQMYTIEDDLCVDHVARYEHIQSELEVISKAIGLPKVLELPDAKSGFRAKNSNYRDALDEEARGLIEQICQKELKLFGYEW